MSDADPTAAEGGRPDKSGLPVAPGTVIAGKYRVDEVVASGGMGVVASGEHLKLSQRVAIKFMRAWTEEGVARFEREARACARIQSEHIARVLDVDVLPNGSPFMVMEFLVGTDLSDVLKQRGRLPIAEAVDYVLQACEGLAEAHRNDIIHRDLKPANLFLTRRPDGSALVKVLDFGVSKMRSSEHGKPGDDLTTTNSIMGSPSYMSPEQLREARNVDPRADVWGIGAVLYKLVAGRNPFVAESTPDLCIKILTEGVPPITEVDLPKGFFAVIQGCLEKNRESRYASVAEVAEALRPWAPGESVDRVVRTLGTVAKPVHERTPTAAAEGGAETRLATTVDPSVSDAPRVRRSWRAPLVGIVVGAGIAVTWVAATHKTPSPTPVASETVQALAPPSTSTNALPIPPTVPQPTSTPTASASATVIAAAPRPRPAASTIAKPPASVSSAPPPSVSSAPANPPSEFERFGGRK